MNIAIIGFRGTGKTTISNILSRKLGKKLISTDDEVEKKIKTTIEKFVKKSGWDNFRDIETEVVERISNLDECIFDTGGGIVIRNENVTNLKKNSLMILLTADIKTIAERLKKSKRPALTKKGYIEEIRDVIQEREQRYKNAADYTLDTSRISPEEASDLIVHYISMEMQ